MFSVLEKTLRGLMWAGAPLTLILAFLLGAVGIEPSKEVSGMICLLFGIFTVACFFVGAWTIIT